MTSVEAVLDGIYDAAAATENRFLQVSAGEKLVALKRFADEGYLIAGRPTLTTTAASNFRRAMIELKDPALLQSFWPEASGFEPCEDSDFAQLRQKLLLESLFDEDTPTEQSSSSTEQDASR
jgi:hypothetical protein